MVQDGVEPVVPLVCRRCPVAQEPDRIGALQGADRGELQASQMELGRVDVDREDLWVGRPYGRELKAEACVHPHGRASCRAAERYLAGPGTTNARSHYVGRTGFEPVTSSVSLCRSSTSAQVLPRL